MAREFEGKLVRFGKMGVGVVDVPGVDQYVYFTPKNIVGYVGETVEELMSRRNGQWTEGQIVVIEGDVQADGIVQVDSVALKAIA